MVTARHGIDNSHYDGTDTDGGCHSGGSTTPLAAPFHHRHAYGIAASVSYLVGLVCAFVALQLSQMHGALFSP
jgi:hypothetical protein